MHDSTNIITPYDRLRGQLLDVSTTTKPTTIQTHEPITGRAITYIIRTYRNDHGDFIFIEYIDENTTVTRIVVPPQGANAIAAQRQSLSTRRRSAAGKERAKAMTEEQKQVLRDRLAKFRKENPNWRKKNKKKSKKQKPAS